MVIASIYKQAHLTPDKTAVVYNGVDCSYANFARRIDVTRRYFAAQRLPADSVVVIDVLNLFEGWILGLALRALGLTTFTTRRVRDVAALDVKNIGCVVTLAAENKSGAAERVSENPWRAIEIPDDLERHALQAPIPAVFEPTVRPGNHILLTSGTTGTYKKVMRNAAMENLSIPLHAEINGISRDSVVYVANFGLWTAGGYRWPLITWSVGGTVIIHQTADQHVPLERHSITHIFTGPDMLADLMRSANGTLRRDDTRRLLVTVETMPHAMLAAAKRDVTSNVFSVLASTEALTVAVTPIERPDDLLWHRIHPSREVQVVDEAGNKLGPGKEGLIRIRIIDGLTGYLDDEIATRTFFRDGYFYPGDLGMFGHDGRLSLRGRESDVINVLSVKIATGPIEQALQNKLGVEGVCILSIPNANAEDDIYIVIQSSRPLARAEIEAAGRTELGAIKRVPVRVVQMESLPRNETGKVLRRELKRRVISLLASKPQGHA